MRSNNHHHHRQVPFCTTEILMTLILLLLVLPEISFAEAQPQPQPQPQSNSNTSPGEANVVRLLCMLAVLIFLVIMAVQWLIKLGNNILNSIDYASTSFQRARQVGVHHHHHHHPPPHANLSTAQERGTRSLDHHHQANLGRILVYSEVKRLNIAAGRGGELVCPVCLSDFHDQDALLLLTKCHHAFHPHCIHIWLQNHSTCPLCRSNVLAAHSVCRTVLPTTTPTMIQPQNYDVALPVDRRDEDVAVVMETNHESTGTDHDVVLEFNTIRFNPFLPRSNSTGHSLMNEPGDNMERFTSRSPVEVTIQILNPELHRSTSFDLAVSCQY